MNKIDEGMIKDGEDQLKKIESMISSMTLEEKQKPEVLAAQPSRRQRIAQGSGYEAKDVDKVLADFSFSIFALPIAIEGLTVFSNNPPFSNKVLTTSVG